MIISHAYTILDANADSPEVGWPSLVVGDVNSTMVVSLRWPHIVGEGNERLNSDTIAGLKFISSGIAGAVMHIKANVMTQVVWEKRRDCLSQSVASCKTRVTFSYTPRKIKSELLQLIFQSILRNPV